MKSMESYLRRTHKPLQKIAKTVLLGASDIKRLKSEIVLQKIAKTVLLGANDIKRLKSEIVRLNKIIKKQEKKYSKLYKTYSFWHQKNIAKQQTITNSEVPS